MSRISWSDFVNFRPKMLKILNFALFVSFEIKYKFKSNQLGNEFTFEPTTHAMLVYIKTTLQTTHI